MSVPGRKGAAAGSGQGWTEGAGCRAGESLSPLQLVFPPAKWTCHIFPVHSSTSRAGGEGRGSKAAQTSVGIPHTALHRWICPAPVWLL